MKLTPNEPANQGISPEKALWALFKLLPVDKEILFFSDNSSKLPCIKDFLRKGEHLQSKGVSDCDLKALLHASDFMKIEQEVMFKKRIEAAMSRFQMTCEIGIVRVATSRSNCKYLKSITIKSDHLLHSKRNRSALENEQGVSETWEWEKQCRKAINHASRCYFNRKRKVNNSNQLERNTRSKRGESKCTASSSCASQVQFNSRELERPTIESTTTFRPTTPTQIEEPRTHVEPPQAPPLPPPTPPLLQYITPQDPPIEEAPPPPEQAALDPKIHQAEALNFSNEVRMDQNNQVIEIGDHRIPDFLERQLIALTAISMGYKKKKRGMNKRILNAARRTVHYHCGLPEPGKFDKSIKRFVNKFIKSIDRHDPSLMPMNNKKRNKASKVKKIMETYPDLLHRSWREAVKIHSDKASFQQITAAINRLLESWGHGHIILKQHNIREFFKQAKGSLIREKFVPLLDDSKKNLRVQWCEWIQNMMNDNQGVFYVCYLDEKWFYMTSGRSKRKIIPAAPFENSNSAYIQAPSTRSRRFVVKVMYLGVITPPSQVPEDAPAPPDGWKNGKISLHRVCKKKTRRQTSRNKKFVAHGAINHAISHGDWRYLLPDEDEDDPITVGEVFDIIAVYYDIDPYIREHLCFTYQTKKRTKLKRIELFHEHEEEELFDGREIKMQDGSTRGLTVEDLDLFVRYEQGEEFEEDCSCDSAFMERTMSLVGQEIRDYFFWVPNEERIYLVLDNAGGHGTNAMVQQYKAELEQDFNIELVHQVPNSPETNLLDLGVWRAVQSKVEKLSWRKRQDPNVLAETVEQAWDDFQTATIGKVYKRWKRVLELIKLDGGGNRYVEELRGRLTNDPNANEEDEDTAFAARIEAIRNEQENDEG